MQRTAEALVKDMAGIFGFVPNTVESCSGACAWLCVKAVHTKVELGTLGPCDNKSYLLKKDFSRDFAKT